MWRNAQLCGNDHYIHPWRQVAAAEEDLPPLSHLRARRRAQGELPSVPPLPASCG